MDIGHIGIALDDISMVATESKAPVGKTIKNFHRSVAHPGDDSIDILLDLVFRSKTQ
jgi:hypothetical protein